MGGFIRLSSNWPNWHKKLRLSRVSWFEEIWTSGPGSQPSVMSHQNRVTAVAGKVPDWEIEGWTGKEVSGEKTGAKQERAR